MLRIAVLGNCQAHGLVDCLRFYQPSGDVDPFILPELKAQFRNEAAVLAKLATYDVVVSIWPIAGFFGNLDDPAVAAACPNVIQCPLVTFGAFHPDCIYVDRKDTSQRVHTPLGDYNSALTLLAYLEGLSVHEALLLFCLAVYERVGYLDAWASSEASLLGTGLHFSFPLERAYRSWIRRGVFMHTINHPKLFVFADLAAEILLRCGVKTNSRLVESYVPDVLLSNCVWPVYPEVGSALSLPGCYVFKAGPKFLDLRSFVEESYAGYSRHPRELISSDRIDSWRHDVALMEFVLSHAGRPRPASPNPKTPRTYRPGLSWLRHARR
jgi:hypothetical protein